MWSLCRVYQLHTGSTGSTQASTGSTVSPHRYPQAPQCLHTIIHRLHTGCMQASTQSLNMHHTGSTRNPQRFHTGFHRLHIGCTQNFPAPTQSLHCLHSVHGFYTSILRLHTGSTQIPIGVHRLHEFLSKRENPEPSRAFLSTVAISLQDTFGQHNIKGPP